MTMRGKQDCGMIDRDGVTFKLFAAIAKQPATANALHRIVRAATLSSVHIKLTSLRELGLTQRVCVRPGSREKRHTLTPMGEKFADMLAEKLRQEDAEHKQCSVCGSTDGICMHL